jgi:hypothetical protein
VTLALFENPDPHPGEREARHPLLRLDPTEYTELRTKPLTCKNARRFVRKSVNPRTKSREFPQVRPLIR